MKEPTKKTDRASTRTTPRQREALEKTHLKYGTPLSLIIRELLDAYADAVEREGDLRHPFFVTSKESVPLLQVAEGQSTYAEKPDVKEKLKKLAKGMKSRPQ